MALLSVQDASDGLANVTMVAATGGGDTMPSGTRAAGWDLGVFQLVRNGHTAAQTVTVNGVGYNVPANGGIAVIPVYSLVYGTVKAITYSGVTALTVAAVRMAGD